MKARNTYVGIYHSDRKNLTTETTKNHLLPSGGKNGNL